MPVSEEVFMIAHQNSVAFECELEEEREKVRVLREAISYFSREVGPLFSTAHYYKTLRDALAATAPEEES